MKVGLRLALLLTLAAFVAASSTASAQCIMGVGPECQKQTVPEDQRKSGDAGQVQAAPVAPKPAEAGLLDTLGAFVGAIGSEMGRGADAVGGAVAAGFAGIGAVVVGLLRGLAEGLVGLKPRGVDSQVYAGAVAGGFAATTFAAQAGSLWAWRKLFPLGIGLGLFSRIEKDELLENERRARIFELIRANPGIHLSEIARELDFAWGTTLHHLRKLRADHLILYKEMGHHKSFFVNGSGLSEKQMEAMSLIKNGTLSRLAQYLETHPRVSLKELSEALQISPPLAAFHIRKLEKAGLVQKVRDGKSVRLSTTQALPAGFLQTIAAPAPPAAMPDAAS